MTQFIDIEQIVLTKQFHIYILKKNSSKHDL
jgi:hypothetical protein